MWVALCLHRSHQYVHRQNRFFDARKVAWLSSASKVVLFHLLVSLKVHTYRSVGTITTIRTIPGSTYYHASRPINFRSDLTILTDRRAPPKGKYAYQTARRSHSATYVEYHISRRNVSLCMRITLSITQESQNGQQQHNNQQTQHSKNAIPSTALWM